jgi:phage FluMu protein Com
MGTGQRIQKLGFKRWYERTLIEGHAYLVTSFLGLIMAFSGIEVMGADNGSLVVGVLLGLGGSAIAMFGMPRYLRMLALAQTLGGRAHCPRCKVYAAFNVLASGPAEAPENGRPAESGPVWLRVRCRKCANEWRM